jgi:hypothetical protein
VPPSREGDQVGAVRVGVEDGDGRVLVKNHARLNAQRPGPQVFRHVVEVGLGVCSPLLFDDLGLLPPRLPRRIAGRGHGVDDPKQRVLGLDQVAQGDGGFHDLFGHC